MNIYDDISRLMDIYGSSRAPTHRENQEHFKRLVTCEDETELNAYVTANIRLAASVVTKFLKRHRRAIYLVDDLFSTALCIMFVSLKSLVKQAKGDPGGFWDDKSGIGRLDEYERFSVSMYLYISMYRSVQKCFERDSVEAISQSTAVKFTPEGSQKPLRKISIHRKNLEELHYDHFNILILLNDILEHCETDFERNIIKMRLSQDDQKISEILGVSRLKILRTRAKIYERCKRSLLIMPD